MNAIHLDPETRRFRARAAVAQVAVLLAVVAGLGVIGATTPERQHVTTNCAFDPGATGTLSDATLELAGVCGNGTPVEREGGAIGARYGVPDAKSSLDPRAQPEPLPPTF